MYKSKAILPIIVISQFCCTSLWFAGNAVMGDLISSFGLEASALGHLTSFVQFGFIVGTLCFAILCISDRYSPSKVFVVSALLGAICNLGTIWDGNDLWSILSFRFLTGFFLAGIYPVGMKIAADHYDKGLGKSLGFLVGALVLGTAFPHLLKNFNTVLPWKSVIIVVSSLAALGGVLMVVLVPDGPYRKKSAAFHASDCLRVFQNRKFRSAAFGYFGHMWELYAFWVIVPILLTSFALENSIDTLSISLWSFLIIGVGSVACIAGGYLSQLFGTERTASVALLLSGVCCLLLPAAFMLSSLPIFLSFLLVWGMVVIADSPLFSTLVAQNAPADIKGTALTIVSCIGFSITIVSIQMLTYLVERTGALSIYMILALGPMFGLVAMARRR